MQVVKSNQNLLCLGRSGTGKTTTSVLRLFAQEVVYLLITKQKALNEQYKMQLANAKLIGKEEEVKRESL